MRRTKSSKNVVADACGLNHATVSNILGGRRLPNYLTLKRLHEGTGIPYSAMFEED